MGLNQRPEMENKIPYDWKTEYQRLYKRIRNAKRDLEPRIKVRPQVTEMIRRRFKEKFCPAFEKLRETASEQIQKKRIDSLLKELKELEIKLAERTVFDSINLV